GYKPKFEEVKKVSVAVADKLFCGSAAHKPEGITDTVVKASAEVTCSGEVFFGFVGGVATRVATWATVEQGLKALLKHSTKRVALIETIGIMATSFIMLAGFSASAHLWTSAVHVIGDKQKEEKAHNLFGRAAMNIWNWSEYTKTEDGQLAQEVFGNMYKILRIDKKLRQAWIYNFWRFGMARGEIVMNLGILMGAMAGGAYLGTATAAAVGATGAVSTWFISFAVVTALAVSVSIAMIASPDFGVGESLTKVIQATRGAFAQSQHYLVKQQLTIATDAFDVHRTFSGRFAKYKKLYENRTRRHFENLRTQRVAYANVILEKYHDLREHIEKAEANIAMAREVLQNSEFRSQIMVKDGDEYLSYDQARKKVCNVDTRDYACDLPVAAQLLTIDKAKEGIKEARLLLVELGEKLFTIYMDDADFLQGLMDKRNLQFPTDIGLAIAAETEDLKDIGAQFLLYMAATHKEIALVWSVPFESEERRMHDKIEAREKIEKYHANGIDEEKIVAPLRKGRQH
ncbi:MAG: hypothetical protein AB7H97_17490, partial [Pseudobdellovibrionaceae bacterium]